MSISDDIKPRKFRRPDSFYKEVVPEKSPEVKKEIEKTSIKSDEFFDTKHEDDFFADIPIEKSKLSKKRKTADHHEPNDKHETKNHHFYSILITLAIVALIALVAFQNWTTIKSYFDGSYKNTEEAVLDTKSTTQTETTTKTTTPTEINSSETTPTAIAAPVVNPKAEITLSVLNGTSTKNLASTYTESLKAEGYNVTYTGNAKVHTYATTIIYYKSGTETKAETLKASLTDKNPTLTENASVVGSNFDLVLVIGTN